MANWVVIVVGAGSAGAALAYRLTEDSDRCVLLLEAGPNHTSAETPDPIRGKSLFGAVGESGPIPAEGRPESEWSRFDRRLLSACVDRGHRRVSTNDAHLTAVTIAERAASFLIG